MLYYVFYTSTPLRNTSAYKIIESENKLSFDRIRAKANDFIKENANQYIYDLPSGSFSCSGTCQTEPRRQTKESSL